MTQKTKNILLVVGFVIALILLYNLNISRTFEIKEDVNKLRTEARQFENINSLYGGLDAKEQYLDSILKENNIDKNSSLQNNLLERLTILASDNNFKISDFQEPHTFSEEGVTINSYNFILTGDYEAIERVIYTIERNSSFGKIQNVTFEKKRDYRRRKDYLVCSIILENLVSE